MFGGEIIQWTYLIGKNVSEASLRIRRDGGSIGGYIATFAEPPAAQEQELRPTVPASAAAVRSSYPA